jgi:hypothetical protein
MMLGGLQDWSLDFIFQIAPQDEIQVIHTESNFMGDDRKYSY